MLEKSINIYQILPSASLTLCQRKLEAGPGVRKDENENIFLISGNESVTRKKFKLVRKYVGVSSP